MSMPDPAAINSNQVLLGQGYKSPYRWMQTLPMQRAKLLTPPPCKVKIKSNQIRS
jgi:hypothetical protein